MWVRLEVDVGRHHVVGRAPLEGDVAQHIVREAVVRRAVAAAWWARAAGAPELWHAAQTCGHAGGLGGVAETAVFSTYPCKRAETAALHAARKFLGGRASGL